MKSVIKGLVLVGIGLGSLVWALYAGLFSSFPDSCSDSYEITSIDIQYTGKFGYKITNIGGEYYTMTGKKIDSDLIYKIADSFTDLYEVDEYVYQYNEEELCDARPLQFIITLHLASGEDIVAKSDTDIHYFCIYYCYLPWYVEYNDKLYAQYSGKIPTALLSMLHAIDVDWLQYKEKICWGCYPAEVPKEYAVQGVSSDFPESAPVVLPEVGLGNQHVLWHINVSDTIRSYTDLPRYYQGTVCIATEQGLLWVDSQTGKKLQEIGVDSIECIYSNEHVFVVYQNKLLCFDLQKQEKIWEFQAEPGEECGCHWKAFAVGEGRIYISYEPARVYCIDEATKKKDIPYCR